MDATVTAFALSRNPVIYPEGLTTCAQVWLTVGLMALNVLLYSYVWKRKVARR